jgi:hypothetical protein
MIEAMIKPMERKIRIGIQNSMETIKKIIPMILSIWAVDIIMV